MPDKEFDLDKFFDSLDDDDTVPKEEALDDKPETVDDTDDTPKDDDGQKEPELSLDERLALLEKENKGLKKDIVKVRTDRREARDQFNQLKGMIEQAATQKKAGSQSDDKAGGKTDPLKDLKLSIEYDDDGNPYVPANALAEILKGQEKKLESTAEEIKARDAQRDEMARVQSEIESVISKDEKYPSAFNMVKSALDDLNARVIEIQKDGRAPQRVLSIGEGMEVLEREGALDEWQEKFPDMDPDIIAHAFESKRSLNKALKFVSSLDKSTPTNDDKKTGKTPSKDEQSMMDKLSNKPSSHGKGGTKVTESIVDKVAGFSTEDILSLSDKDIDKLMRKMRAEELESTK